MTRVMVANILINTWMDGPAVSLNGSPTLRIGRKTRMSKTLFTPHPGRPNFLLLQTYPADGCFRRRSPCLTGDLDNLDRVLNHRYSLVRLSPTFQSCQPDLRTNKEDAHGSCILHGTTTKKISSPLHTPRIQKASRAKDDGRIRASNHCCNQVLEALHKRSLLQSRQDPKLKLHDLRLHKPKQRKQDLMPQLCPAV
jgi:hypothetical protein